MDAFFFDQTNMQFRPPHLVANFVELTSNNHRMNNNHDILADPDIMDSVLGNGVLPIDSMVATRVPSVHTSTATADARLNRTGLFFDDKTGNVSHILKGMQIRNGIPVVAHTREWSSKRLDEAVSSMGNVENGDDNEDEYMEDRFSFDDSGERFSFDDSVGGGSSEEEDGDEDEK